MSNLVIVLGSSGDGKSTSIQGLDPNETLVINILGKRLPFKGSAISYSKKNKNISTQSSWNGIIQIMEYMSKNKPEIKNIVIDDAVYIMRDEFFERAKEKGYDKYNDIAAHMKDIIDKSSALRDDMNVFMLMHSETIETDGSIVGYRCSTVGKLLDRMCNPLENVAITLFCKPKFDDKGNPEFGFWTHKMKVDGIEIPAKTPRGMFEDDFIPNDLGLVVKAMKEYYGK